MASRERCATSLRALGSAASAAAALPRGDARALVHATCPGPRAAAHALSRRVAALARALATRYAPAAPPSDVDAPADADDASSSSACLAPRDAVFDHVCDATAEALQAFNSALDAARGVKDAAVPLAGALEPRAAGPLTVPARQPAFVEMEKPQVHFPDYPIDNSDAPFVPPYCDAASLPADAADGADKARGVPRLGQYMQDLFKANSNPHVGGAVGRPHPYDDEITAATERMAAQPVREEEAVVYKTPEETPCTYVTTEEELFFAAERLKQASEIAVDIENHSVRSFQGFVCLIQISTRREDFVFDALALRGSIHRALAPLFADETTVKVLHGADKDVQWLERDFGMYVVNMFDTGQAARLLGFPSASLSYLQAKFCNVTGINKRKFQLADWRQRPLPDDMFEYARSDTHYLLYVYDRLRSELAKKALISKAWEKSAIISRKRHSKLRFDPGIARFYAARFGLCLDQHQTRLLEELCRWRDRVAREEDESLQYVVPLNTLLKIARAKDNARTVDGLLMLSTSSNKVPSLVKLHAEDLVRLICDVLDAKITEPDKETKASEPSTCGGDERPAVVMSTIERSVGSESQMCEIIEGFDEAVSPGKVLNQRTASEGAPQKEMGGSVKVSTRHKSTLFDLDSSDSSDDDAGYDGSKSNRYSDLVELAEQSDHEANRKDRSGLKHKKDVPSGSTKLEDVTTRAQQKSSDDVARDGIQPRRQEGILGEKPKRLCDTGEKEEATGNAMQFSIAPQLVQHSTDIRAAAALRSAFDMSEDEDDLEREGAAAIVARVQAGLKLHAPKGPSDFQVETDKTSEESGDIEARSLPSLGKRKRESQEAYAEALEDEWSEPMSLKQQFGPGGEKRKKRKGKQSKGKSAGKAIAERMAPFDYRKAAAADEGPVTKGVKNGKQFDALQRLSEGDGGPRRRVRKSRKRPASGLRSMSFRAR